uniref:CAZy families GH36 protein n=1 Tax=uncultured Brachybacterium sp. TaxID=189680 RepID=A0A060C4P6_9MICO|nr:CAZy families GH36 protein [uncultured Brachybacterium sp.]
MDPAVVDTVHLHTGHTSVVIQTPNGQAPEVLHWGVDLSDLDPEGAHALSRACAEPYDGNAPNHPLQVGIIPLSSTGWMGRPGLVGHRASGRAWAPHLRTISVDVDSETSRCSMPRTPPIRPHD